MTLKVYITVDVEVWPPDDGRWPRVPLLPDDHCTREIAAHFWGESSGGSFGLPYQLDVLARYGLRATFFVDPMFSFALGLQTLRDVVGLIQSSGQHVGLHLHPEWLTDPRCPALPGFKGPMIGDYPAEDQYRLICIARDRLLEAGACPPRSFRAGNWGASTTTLQALARAGIATDASLNGGHVQSFPDLPLREVLQGPVALGDVTELPMTRFNDGLGGGGRPLSFVGVSRAEMRTVLDQLHAAAAPSAVMVMHSNEFVRTEMLRDGSVPRARHLVRRRYEALCRHIARHPERYATCFVDELERGDAARSALVPMAASGILATSSRLVEQVISRWF